MSPRIGRARYRTAAGGSTGSTGSTGATALVAEVRFNGLSQDYYQWPDGDGTPTWYADTTGTLFPAITALGAATNDNSADEVRGDVIFMDGGVSGSTGDGFFRHNMAPGVNQGGGALVLDLTSTAIGGPFPELWLKWRQRYPGGLRPTSAWSTATSTGTGNGAWGYNKDMALNNDGGIGRIELGQKNGGVAIAGHFDDWGADATSDGSNKYHANLSSNLGLPSTLGFSFRAQMVGQISSGDNQWHTYQVHVVKDSGSSRDGVYEAWFDGVQVASHSTCRWSGGSTVSWGFRQLRISNNQSAPGTDSTSIWQDYDDILISVTGYITQD